jgi:serralysin
MLASRLGELSMHFRARVAVAAVVWVGLGASTARATFHLWKIDEVYSNAGGSVQFVEFQQPSFMVDDERFLNGITLTDSALGHSFTFPANLPSEPQPNSHFLVVTPGYAALAGVPAPDYVLPANDFFSTSGDTLTYASGVDTLSFTGSQLPTDGTNSLNRAYGASTFTSDRNSPTNFAGQTGSVPEPAALALLVAGGLLVSRRRARRPLV